MAASAAGAGQINLSWTASTDNVRVSGYRLERCQGAGCANFSQIATPAGTSATDSGLADSTSYSYRVRAADAAGNLSGFSAVSSATTPTPTPPPPPPPPPPANVPWVNNLAVGQWFQIPNTALSGVDPSPVPPGNTGPQSKVQTWTSFVVDTRTSKVYSVAGGGHTDYAGNEVDELTLELAQPVWTQKLAPTPSGSLTNCQSYYNDGRPASRHTYYGVTLDVVNDRIMLFGGAPWCSAGGFHSAVSSYQINANTYNQQGTHPSIVNQGAATTEGGAAYSVDPATGDVYKAQFSNYAKWTRSTNSWSVLNPLGSGPEGLETMSAMDTTRGRILFVGGSSDDHHLYTLANNTFTAITLNGANAANVAGAGQAAMIYVPAMDRYLVRLAGAGGTIYQINPATFEVTTFATTGGGSVPGTQSGPYNKFLYVPRLGGAIYVPSYSANAWFVRLH
ncbi:MAG TPA: fibronectin type III domain-containing protein [Gemmatimonadales bacterium]|jgi:chitodextrinase|uniref:fibronectin type III domain-containing protein n=1 Tax=Actinocrinis sp. TaxID=1920516 RepID=UPI002C8B5CFF|nr:fibronectin type III domain-containing protein [Actinocrinis sp.]HXR71764.1 fibronectin type III domain-containing protein [Actinocrinis sp.]HYU90093.1 fibronectin type III domain-containing protein [Gemmatimonadales bacterium]